MRCREHKGPVQVPQSVGGRDRPRTPSSVFIPLPGLRRRESPVCRAVLATSVALALEAAEEHLLGSAQPRPAPPLPTAQELGGDTSPSCFPHNGSQSMIHRGSSLGAFSGRTRHLPLAPGQAPGVSGQSRRGVNQ